MIRTIFRTRAQSQSDRQAELCRLAFAAYRASLGNSGPFGPFNIMIAITITPAAYQAIKASLVPRIDGPTPDEDGLIRLWLDRKFVDRLSQMRGPSDTYSDVILRLAAADP